MQTVRYYVFWFELKSYCSSCVCVCVYSAYLRSVYYLHVPGGNMRDEKEFIRFDTLESKAVCLETDRQSAAASSLVFNLFVFWRSHPLPQFKHGTTWCLCCFRAGPCGSGCICRQCWTNNGQLRTCSWVLLFSDWWRQPEDLPESEKQWRKGLLR